MSNLEEYKKRMLDVTRTSYNRSESIIDIFKSLKEENERYYKAVDVYCDSIRQELKTSPEHIYEFLDIVMNDYDEYMSHDHATNGDNDTIDRILTTIKPLIDTSYMKYILDVYGLEKFYSRFILFKNSDIFTEHQISELKQKITQRKIKRTEYEDTTKVLMYKIISEIGVEPFIVDDVYYTLEELIIDKDRINLNKTDMSEMVMHIFNNKASIPEFNELINSDNILTYQPFVIIVYQYLDKLNAVMCDESYKNKKFQEYLPKYAEYLTKVVKSVNDRGNENEKIEIYKIIHSMIDTLLTDKERIQLVNYIDNETISLSVFISLIDTTSINNFKYIKKYWSKDKIKKFKKYLNGRYKLLFMLS